MACSQVLFRLYDDCSRVCRATPPPLTRPSPDVCSVDCPITLEPALADWLCAVEPIVPPVVLPVVSNASCALFVASAIVLPSDLLFRLIGCLGYRSRDN